MFLEKALDHECLHNWCDSDINGAILKYYQLCPNETPKIEVLVKILLKSLMQLPDSDFAVNMMMIPEKYQNVEEVKVLCSLAEFLQMAKFVEFWNLYKANVSLTAKAVGFEHFARKYIVKMIGLTYREISTELLAKYLSIPNVNDLSAAQGVLDEGFAMMDSVDGIVTFQSNANNHPKSTRMIGSEVRLDAVAPLIVQLEISPKYSNGTPSASTTQAIERMKTQIQQINNTAA